MNRVMAYFYFLLFFYEILELGVYKDSQFVVAKHISLRKNNGISRYLG